MQRYENGSEMRSERRLEKAKEFLISADALEEANLLCAECRGELGCFIEDGRIIVEVRDNEAPGVNEGEI